MSNLNRQQLEGKIQGLQRAKKYAWGKYYGEVGNNLEQTTQQYQQIKNVVEFIPPHIKEEYMGMLEELKKSIECPICMEIINKEDLQLSNCGHKYCSKCYDKIIEINNKCAICKKKLKWS